MQSKLSVKKTTFLIFFLFSFLIAFSNNAEARIELSTKKGDFGVSGKFDFFWSQTKEHPDFQTLRPSGLMQHQETVAFDFSDKIDESNKYTWRFELRKKYGDGHRMRGSLIYENETLGGLGFSSHLLTEGRYMLSLDDITHGSRGNWDRNANFAFDVKREDETFLPNPQHTHYFTNHDDSLISNKGLNVPAITYFAPNFYGLKFGFSYSPSLYFNPLPKTDPFRFNQDLRYKNLVTAGLSFDKEINPDTKVQLTVLGEHAVPEARNINLTDLNTLSLAGILSYSNWNIGAVVGLFGESNHKKIIHTSLEEDRRNFKGNSYFYDLAASLTLPKGFGFSLGYYKSTSMQDYAWIKEDDEEHPFTNGELGRSHLDSFSVGLDYKVKENARTYVEFNRFTTKSNNALEKTTSNQGNVFLFGTSLGL